MRSSDDECPRCGAPLPARVAGVNIRTCGYCHTTDARRPEDQHAEPPLAHPHPFSESNVRSQYFVAAGVGFVVLALALVGALNAARVRPAPPPPVPPAPSPIVEQTVETAPPRERLRALAGLVLIEQDDRADAFLVFAAPLGGGDGRWLTARDPANGRELWRRSLDGSDAPERILRIPLGDTLVVALPRELWGLDAGSGQSSWQRARASDAVRACAAEHEFGLVGADGTFAAYSITTGSPASLSRAACDDVYASNADAPNFEFVDAAKAARWLPNGAGFRVKRGLVPRHGSAQVVLGAESNGTPSVGVVTGRRWLWQANVANEAPALAELTTPPLAAVREECVVVAFVAKSGVVLTALGLESGDRRWTTPLPQPNGASPAAAGELAISRGGHVAYRAGSGEFWVLSLDTGVIEWTLHGQQ